MKRYTAIILTLLITGLLAAGCGKTSASPAVQTGETILETTEGDPIVEEKQEDPETVLEGEVDISLLESPGGETVPSETADVSSEIIVEETVPVDAPAETPTEEMTTMPEKGDDGYFNLVIKF